MSKQDWAALKALQAGSFSEEESRIVDLLIAGKSTVEIGRILRQHRSMVWRKIERIKKRASGSPKKSQL